MIGLRKSHYLVSVQAPFLHHVKLLHSDASRGLLCHHGRTVAVVHAGSYDTKKQSDLSPRSDQSQTFHPTLEPNKKTRFQDTIKRQKIKGSYLNAALQQRESADQCDIWCQKVKIEKGTSESEWNCDGLPEITMKEEIPGYLGSRLIGWLSGWQQSDLGQC